MIGENYYLYYLAHYQAVLDKNLTKLVNITNLTNEEKLNYPEEYPHLDANEIFKTTHPMDLINFLLRTAEYEEFYLKLDNARNLLATEENIAIREKLHLKLLKHPLIDYCPSDKSSIIDNLLAVSYSKVITKAEVITKLTPLLNKSPIIDDVLSVSISTTINHSKPFSIALIDKKMETYDPTLDSMSGGYNNNITNRLVVTNEDAKLNLEFIAHELAHKTMHKLFHNGAKPYNGESSKEKYHSTIKNTLLNIQKFIQQDFGLSIIFEDQNDTWKMGKTLSTMLFPQYLKGNETQEFTSLLKEYNLNIGDKLPWLDGYTPLGLALSCQKFELANSLVKAGATIKPTIIHIASEISYTDIFNWFLENQSTIDMNHKDCEGMTALDYASDPEIIKTIISAGAIAYPANFEPICDLNPKCYDEEDDSTIIEEQLLALKKLLNFYNQDYNQSQEDDEFIVRLPQIIADGLYQGKIVEVLEPLAEYWREDISPAVASYQEQHDLSEICLAPLDYNYFF